MPFIEGYKRQYKSLPKGFVEHLESCLDEIGALTKLDRVSFSNFMEDPEGYPTKESEVDAFIKRRIRVYLQNIDDEVEAIRDAIG